MSNSNPYRYFYYVKVQVARSFAELEFENFPTDWDILLLIQRCETPSF